MPGVAKVLPAIHLPMTVWANTRSADEARILGVLERIGIGRNFQRAITSTDAGARKPAAQFFRYALQMRMESGGSLICLQSTQHRCHWREFNSFAKFLSPTFVAHLFPYVVLPDLSEPLLAPWLVRDRRERSTMEEASHRLHCRMTG
jgi:hypothetical protein